MTAALYWSPCCFSALGSLSNSDLGSRSLSASGTKHCHRAQRGETSSQEIEVLPIALPQPFQSSKECFIFLVSCCKTGSCPIFNSWKYKGFFPPCRVPRETCPSCPVAPQRAAMVRALKHFLAQSALPEIPGMLTTNHDISCSL